MEACSARTAVNELALISFDAHQILSLCKKLQPRRRRRTTSILRYFTPLQASCNVMY